MARRTYNTKVWKYTRLAKLSAAPYCEHCGAPATQVDHITPVESGGPEYDLSNLQSLCQRCHSAKTAMADGGFGNRRGKARIRGCDVNGMPLDPNHPWNQEKNLPERQSADRALRSEES